MCVCHDTACVIMKKKGGEVISKKRICLKIVKRFYSLIFGRDILQFIVQDFVGLINFFHDILWLKENADLFYRMKKKKRGGKEEVG